MDELTMENIELLNEVYTMCIVSKVDVQEEKRDLLEQYLQVYDLMLMRFAGNKNLEKALTYFSSAMQDFFDETEFENQVYEAMIAYMEHFLNLTDFQDTNLLEEFNAILEEFDTKVDRRYYESTYLYEHYIGIIKNGILTDKNYYYRGLTQKSSEEKKKTTLAKIPEVN